MAIAIGGIGGMGGLNPAMMRIQQLQNQQASQPVLKAEPTPTPVQPRQEYFALAPQPVSQAAPPPPPVAPKPLPAPSPAPEFSAQNNLIAKQLNPVSAGANQYDTQAAQYAQQAGMQGYSGLTKQAQKMILEQLKHLQSAPDRFQLAQDAYNTFQQQSEPQYQQALRGVGQRAAALGRVGAGMTTNDLTGVFGQRNLQLSGERERLINNALQNTMGDRLGVSQAIQSGAGVLGGQDLSMGQAQSQAALGQAGLFGNLAQNQYGREANAWQQQAQQQQYQAGLDQQNIQNQIAQQQLQQAAQNQAWQQQFAQQQLAAQLAAQQNTQYPNAIGGGSISSGQLGYQGY